MQTKTINKRIRQTKKVLKSLPQIAEAVVTKATASNTKELVAQSRLAICKSCPIYTNGYCDSEKGGCGCDMTLKVYCMSCTCPEPFKKWGAYE